MTLKIVFIDNGYAILRDIKDITIENNLLCIKDKDLAVFTETMRYIKSIITSSNASSVLA